MREFLATVREIRYDLQRNRIAWIDCPPGAIPQAGQYIQAWMMDDFSAPLASTLFPAQITERGFLTACPVPLIWEPRTRLELHGPNGRGFLLPGGTKRLALASFANTVARLMPLIRPALENEIALAIFSEVLPQEIPAEVEIYPLESLPELLTWPDVLILDLPVKSLSQLRQSLKLAPSDHLPCPAQALIYTCMPCAGLGSCGVCCVPAHRHWKMACQDGPVFDLNDLEW